MAVPNTFGTATSAIPLSQLDTNFNTPITLGNTAIQLGDTVTTLNNMTLANVTISSGTITITNVAVTTANVSGTANISTLVVVGNETVGGNTSVTGNATVAGSVVLSGGTANGVAYLNTSKQVTTNSALTFDGTNFATTGSVTGSTLRSIRASGSQPEVVLQQTSIASWSIYNPPSSTDLRFYNGSDLLTLNSTSLYTASAIKLSVGSSLSHGKIGSFLSDATTTFSSLGYGMLSLMNSSNTNNNYTWMTFNESNQNYVGAIGTQNINHSAGSSAVYGDLLFATKTNGVGGFPTEKMRLDSSGNLGLGVTPNAGWSGNKVMQIGATGSISGNSSLPLSLAANAYATSAGWSANYIANGYATWNLQYLGEHRWYNAPSGTAGNAITFTQAMTLDASGNLLVGQTSKSQVTVGFYAAANGEVSGCLAASTDAATQWNTYSTGAGAYRFYVGMGGTIFATSIVITAISDQRLKENVRDIDTGLSSIMALKPRRFDWKEGKGQDKKNAAGFIAQEFETVFPECVSTSKAGEDGIEYKNINHETLIPTLVKAIQELKAEFDAYKASHP